MKEHGTKVIGISGGVASGKSLVARIFETWGIPVFRADDVGHEAFLDSKIRQSLHDIWGDTIFDPDGKVNRSRLADLVFGNTSRSSQDLRKLESLIHPYIFQKLDEFRHKMSVRACPFFVLDAPLLWETNLADSCDVILFVDTPLARRQFFAAGRGWTPEELAARQARQISLNEKRKAAHWILDNSGDKSFLESQLRSFLTQTFPEWEKMESQSTDFSCF
ncbi:MAG: dephospho-CoA kinase [Planctomycetia bacterium]|nr:dephospho-CoA kinase [Planctomycetia bacterium]